MMPDVRFPDWNPAKDRSLFEFYEEKYFEPGWAGELTADQARYIRDALIGRAKPSRIRSVRRLRRAWGMMPWQRFISEEAVREVAMNGRPDDPEHNTRLIERCILMELSLLTA
jgi:hypothetical protein